MRRRLIALLLPLLLLTGCWQEEPPGEPEDVLPPPAEEPTEEKSTLPDRFALPWMSGRSLDPVNCADGMQKTVASLMYEGLFRLDGSFDPQPWLCSSYTYENDGKRYTFTLREGVLFSDGSPLTGRDVKATLDRARQSERYRSRLSGISSITARDSTVTVALNSPNMGFPALLDVPIVRYGTQNDTAPVGTGPYFYTEEETGAYLIANQSWWRKENQPAERVALIEASDADAMLYRFSSHEVQMITADLTGTLAVSTTGSVDCLDAATTLLQYVGCNTARAPLDNPILRRALSAGIDRSSLTGAFLSGHGVPAEFPISPVSSLYPADLEVGYSRSSVTDVTLEKPLTLLVNEENGFKKAIVDYLAENWTSEGIPVEVEALPWEEYAARLSRGDFDLYYGEARLTADWNLQALLNPGGVLNYSHWSHPDTSRLIAELAASEERETAAKALCEHLKEQMPLIPVCFKSTSVLTQAGVVQGLAPTAAEPFYNLGQCSINLEPND